VLGTLLFAALAFHLQIIWGAGSIDPNDQPQQAGEADAKLNLTDR
jgi:hypothetical protein